MMQHLDLTQPIHSTDYRIIYGDTDMAGVVYYGNYLRFFEIGRTEYLRSFLGTSYAQLQKQGILLPACEAYCRYKAPAIYDDVIKICTSIVKITRMTLRFHYEIRKDGKKYPIVRGFSVHTAVDRYGKICHLPQKLRDSIKKLLDKKA
jgi:acyl-CoA thioester hydrolase